MLNLGILRRRQKKGLIDIYDVHQGYPWGKNQQDDLL